MTVTPMPELSKVSKALTQPSAAPVMPPLPPPAPPDLIKVVKVDGGPPVLTKVTKSPATTTTPALVKVEKVKAEQKPLQGPTIDLKKEGATLPLPEVPKSQEEASTLIVEIPYPLDRVEQMLSRPAKDPSALEVAPFNRRFRVINKDAVPTEGEDRWGERWSPAMDKFIGEVGNCVRVELSTGECRGYLISFTGGARAWFHPKHVEEITPDQWTLKDDKSGSKIVRSPVVTKFVQKNPPQIVYSVFGVDASTGEVDFLAILSSGEDFHEFCMADSTEMQGRISTANRGVMVKCELAKIDVSTIGLTRNKVRAVYSGRFKYAEPATSVGPTGNKVSLTAKYYWFLISNAVGVRTTYVNLAEVGSYFQE